MTESQTQSSRIRVFDPVGLEESVASPAPGPASKRVLQPQLKGAVLGVITNFFRGYDVPAAVAERIAVQAQLGGIVRVAKPTLSRPAGAAVYTDLAGRVDAVIVGLCA